MTKIVGILNYTINSFSDAGKFFSIDKALIHIKKLFKDGADIVDIGATATSYGATLLSAEEEWDRLEPLLKQCAHNKKISIDTFHYETAEKAINLGIEFINDTSGGKDERMLKVIAASPHVKYIAMFSLVLPAQHNVRISNISEIAEWGEKQIERCMAMGIKKEQIIFDPGIGFVTTPEQSIEVIKNISIYKKLDVPIYIGHSRKSFFTSINQAIPPHERDIETLAASMYLLNKVDYLRVHNVEWHNRAFNVLNKLL